VRHDNIAFGNKHGIDCRRRGLLHVSSGFGFRRNPAGRNVGLHCAGECAKATLAVTFQPHQASFLTRAQQILERSVAAFVEVGTRRAQKLLHLPQIHRPTRRGRRFGQHLADQRDAISKRQLGGRRMRRLLGAAARVAIVRAGSHWWRERRHRVHTHRRYHRFATVRRGALDEFDQCCATRVFERDQPTLFELLGKVAESARPVVAFGERRVQLQQRALEQPQLR
jgi:hypothetical protein